MNTSRSKHPVSFAALLLSLSVPIASAQSSPGASTDSVEGDDSTIRLSPFEVTASGTSGYRADNSISATRVNTPILNVPQVVQVLTRDFLVDRAVFDMETAVEYTAGVKAIAFDNAFLIRGFGAPSYVDGMPMTGGASDTVIIDRVEIVHGPSSALYGTMGPGGVINQVAKRPQAKPFQSVGFSVGDFNLFRGEVDTTGAINDSGTWMYRLTASVQSSQTFRAWEKKESSWISPSLTWLPLPKTSVTVRYDNFAYRLDAPGSVMPLTFDRTRFLDVPWNFNKTEPYAYRDNTGWSVTEIVEHQFNDQWALRHVGRYTYSVIPAINITGFAPASATSPLINRQWRFTESKGDSLRFRTDLTGEFETGPIKHRLLVGNDYLPDTLNKSSFIFFAAPLAPLDPTDWPNRMSYPNQPTGAATLNTHNGTDPKDSYGLYVFDQISLLNERLLLVGGVRYDHFSQELPNFRSTAPAPSYSGSNTSPYIGVTIKPAKNLSLYALASESFVPNFGQNPDGQNYKPTVGENLEAGVKVELMNGRLSGTLAVFKTQQTNLLTIDYSRPNYRLQSGEDTADGFEFQALLSPIDGLQIVPAYAYNDVRHTADTNPALVGLALPDAPKHTFTLWSKYEIPRGLFRNVGLGIGYRYSSEHRAWPYTDTAVQVVGEAYHRWDAALYYRFKIRGGTANISLNLENVFDEQYVDFYAEPGWPRRFTASFRLDF